MAWVRFAASAAVACASRALTSTRGVITFSAVSSLRCRVRTNSSAESGLQRALGGRVLGERDQFLGAAGGGQLLGGLQAEAAYETVRGVVQVPDERAEGGREAALRARDHLGDGQRAGDRPVLRHQLADHHQHDGRDGHAQHGRDGGGGAARGRPPQRAAQQRRERRLGEHADHQRGHGDAELGAGELEGQLAYGLQRALGTALAGLGGTLQLTALDGGQGELGRDEQRAGQCEQEGQQEQQDLGHRATPVPSSACGGAGHGTAGTGRLTHCGLWLLLGSDGFGTVGRCDRSGGCQPSAPMVKGQAKHAGQVGLVRPRVCGAFFGRGSPHPGSVTDRTSSRVSGRTALWPSYVVSLEAVVSRRTVPRTCRGGLRALRPRA